MVQRKAGPAKKAKRGRPPLPAEQRKRNNVTMRLTDRLKSRLQSQAYEDGRSLSEEIELRLELSLISEEIHRLLRTKDGADLPDAQQFGAAMTRILVRLMDKYEPGTFWTDVDALNELERQIVDFLKVVKQNTPSAGPDDYLLDYLSDPVGDAFHFVQSLQDYRLHPGKPEGEFDEAFAKDVLLPGYRYPVVINTKDGRTKITRKKKETK